MTTPAEIRRHPENRLRAAAELVHRSFAGPIGCVFTIGILLASTSLDRDYPLETRLFLGALIARLAPRVVLILLWRRRHEGPAQFPRWMIAASAGLLSVPTGLYTAFVAHQYGFAHWHTLFLFVFAMSCAISGAGAAAPDLAIALAFEATLLIPVAAGCFFVPDTHAAVAGLSVVLFAVYIFLHVIRLNADYWHTVASDLALTKRAEELQAAHAAAQQANQAKGQFLAQMSHEIRTPMNGVLGMLDLVLDTNLGSDQREYLGYARQSAHCLLTLLNDLLDYSKAEAGRLTVERIDFRIRPVVEEAVTPFLAQADARGLALTTTVEDAVPDAVRGDPTRLRQVLTNLVSNAMKFTAAGAIHVAVTLEATTGNTNVLHFSVTDTGPGIPHEKQAEIFEAFSQADHSITRRFGGTGLGLAICRELVDLMHGRIWVESEPGRGSSFQFAAAFGSAAGVAEQPATAQTAHVAGRPLRILIAEDNAINQKLLTRLLEKQGHTYELVSNGAEAFEMAREHRFDLVLMDVQMPVLDGLGATRQIRGTGGPHLPIIGVTAGASPGELEACLAAGMDACITKPIQVPELQNVLARAAAGSFA